MSGAQLQSEWIKLRSLRSTSMIVVLAVALGLGVGALDMVSTAHNWAAMSSQDRSAFDPVADTFSGFQFAELAFGALGVLIVTAEYTHGTIGPTLLATPRRWQVYAAKVLLTCLVGLPVCLASAFAAFLAGQHALHPRGLDVTLGDPHVLRAVLMAGIYLVVVTLVGLGLGACLRHTAGALTSMVALVFLAWPVARAVEGFSYLPDRWLLVNAADVLVSTHAPTGPNAVRTPSFAWACVELITYLVVFLGAGAWRATRDS